MHSFLAQTVQKLKRSFRSRKNKQFVVLLFLGNLLITSSVQAQNCQTSSDYQDLHGEDFDDRREFRCGTGMMMDRMHHERMLREKKGYYDIDGLNFYGSSGYYKKGTKLYYSAHPDTFALVVGGDVASLEIVGNFVRDANSVYSNGKAQKTVNAKKFAVLANTPYAKDDVHVYYNTSIGGYNSVETIQVVEGANPALFETLCDLEENGNCYQYARDEVHVYYAGEKIEDADALTFKLEEMSYARDSKFVYYNGQKLAGSDGPSFEMIDYYYMRDKNQVYVYGQIVPEMDGSKFKLIGTSGMGTDGTRLCYQVQVFADGDPASFVDLGCGYYKDKNNVYSKGQIMQNIDAESFVILSWGFTKDKTSVFCDNEIIPGADPASFEVLSKKYSRDAKNVFYLKTLLKDCQRASFIADPNDPNLGEDAKGTYIRGKRSKN